MEREDGALRICLQRYAAVDDFTEAVASVRACFASLHKPCDWEDGKNGRTTLNQNGFVVQKQRHCIRCSKSQTQITQDDKDSA
jgi:hypothetical protein